MDGLELHMRQCDLHQRWQAILFVQEFFQIAQRARDFVRRRWYKAGGVERAARRSDPVLALAQFARLQAAAAHALHQLGMDFAHQPHRNGQFVKAFKSAFHGAHVVDDFFDIVRPVFVVDGGLGGQQVLQRALRAFDLAGQHRFLADIHENEQVRVWQGQHGAVEPAQRTVGLGKEGGELGTENKRRFRRQACGDEGAIASRLADVLTGAMGRVGKRHAIASL